MSVPTFSCPACSYITISRETVPKRVHWPTSSPSPTSPLTKSSTNLLKTITMPPLTPSAITLPAFKELLSRYPAAVPPKLHDLDTARFTTLPATVAKRRDQNSGDTWLEKAEVLQLVEWKLKHGTFRPTLLKLVASNPAERIEESTRNAFAALPDTAAALPLLTPLSGIGPATASLLLAVAAPERAPFFSDEMR
ncbi:hypothetical protein BU16DRAFT_142557 [Lophium mytilinum]|uniref:Uncharacterized protein n=1 Tax=Lophium mytilinum TaxID=390894 RepID=A0A6A6QFV5_9PEZI|nr:hypothetical protein BU16DRAFT_142557 [Lophium mytilinum]